MIDVEQIPRGTEVVDTANVHVGVVEHHDGTGLRLSHRDAPDRHHHYIPHHWIAAVDGRVHLNRPAADVFDTWPGDHPLATPPLTALAAPKPAFIRPKWVAAALAAAGGIGALLLLF